MKVPEKFLPLGVKAQRVVGAHGKREGGEGAALAGAQGALPHIVCGRGGKDVFLPRPPPRGEVDVEVNALDVCLPQAEIFAAVEGEKKFTAGSVSDGGDALFDEQGAVGVYKRHAPDGAYDGAPQVLEREMRGDVLPRVDGVDGDADGTALPHAKREERTALHAPADDAFFSRISCISCADAAIDVHSAWYAFAAPLRAASGDGPRSSCPPPDLLVIFRAA